MLQFLQLLVGGVAMGCIYALIALGFVLIYKATETVNFAQGELMMLGGFIGLVAVNGLGLPFWLALLATMAAMGVFGMTIERVLLRPLLGQPAFAAVMATIGLGYLLRGVVSMIPGWGTETHALSAPYRNQTLKLGGLTLSFEHLAIILTTCVLVGALFAFFRFTRLGLAMQASSQNQLAACYMGISLPRIHRLIWGIAAAVAGAAGVLLAPITFVHMNMGWIGLKAFPAAVIGGFGSVPGALLGGLIIGVVESLAGFYLDDGFKDVAAYVVVLAMLAFMPHGLLGDDLRKRV